VKEFNAEEFLESLYAGNSRKTHSIDRVFNTICDLLDGLVMQQFDDTMQKLGGPRIMGQVANAPNFTAVDNLLSLVDPSKLDIATALGFLSITNGSKARLNERAAYLDKCEQLWLKTEPKERVDNLLKGLR